MSVIGFAIGLPGYIAYTSVKSYLYPDSPVSGEGLASCEATTTPPTNTGTDAESVSLSSTTIKQNASKLYLETLTPDEKAQHLKLKEYFDNLTEVKRDAILNDYLSSLTVDDRNMVTTVAVAKQETAPTILHNNTPPVTPVTLPAAEKTIGSSTCGADIMDEITEEIINRSSDLAYIEPSVSEAVIEVLSDVIN